MREEGDATRDRIMVVIFPDGGRNYLSKLYNDEWMRRTASSRPPARSSGSTRCFGRATRAEMPDVVLGLDDGPGWCGDRPAAAVRHQPVAGLERPTDDAIDGIVGSVSERGLLERAYRDPSVVERTIGEVMDPPLPAVDVGACSTTRSLSCPAVRRPWSRPRAPTSGVTKLDLLEFLAHRGPRAD